MRNYPLYTGGDDNQSKFKLLALDRAEVVKEGKFSLTINWDEIRPYWQ